jgi:hypothetical protein
MAAEVEPKTHSDYADKRPWRAWEMRQEESVVVIGPKMAEYLAAGGQLPRGRRS